MLQRVLQNDCAVFGAQLVKNFGECSRSLVTFGFGGKDSDSLGVAWRSLGVVALIVIDVTGFEEHGSLVHAVLLALLDSQFVVFEGLRGVVLRKIDVADSAVENVKLLVVLVVLRHVFELADRFLLVGRHECHADACIKIHLHRRIEPRALFVSIIGVGRFAIEFV